MLIAKFWSKAEAEVLNREGKRIQVACWRGSAASLVEAERLAQEALDRVVGRIKAGKGFPDRYGYGDRHLREELLEEWEGDDGLEAVITRNGYGALVLNSANACFIDVDLPRAGFLAMLVHRLRRGKSHGVKAEEALTKLKDWLHAHPDWGVRVYRTHSGLRYLVTHAPFQPDGQEAETAMRALGADPQYVRLCRAQKSFRARLTPKPWRIRQKPLPVRFPWADARAERAARDWQEQYERAGSAYAVCALIDVLGNQRVHPAVQGILDIHDRHSRVSSGLPLA